MKIDSFLSLINQQIEEKLYHGASIALFENNKWQEYYIGTIDGKSLVKENLIYDMASVSKVLGVGTIMAYLYDAKKISLDDFLHDYYSEFKGETVTLRQLLTHSSGLDPFIPNRDSLDQKQLIDALNYLKMRDSKDFQYTDVNFLLLGFMLESYYHKDLAQVFKDYIFDPLKMTHTQFGPVKEAVPTKKGDHSGFVHDPKARVLKEHSGSAGIFSTLKDLEYFCQHYLEAPFAEKLWQNMSFANKTRSIGWNLEGDWIDHTGYTGPFVMINRKKQKAVIFLTNRTYEYDDRPLWIAKRKILQEAIKEL
ncbi:hypothetical protein HMPREF9318_01228 [Streptococcus urinalis FB127-CNA-2]|uniref:Beta-lactamase n=1 Tax=Streptococcus urinalis 2285-97 TaxID=764291 RepID=G5KC76_9STRE|nr:serine hydrolase domain-containing protein [Streptococcus urinalis]EHJ57349.1 beta-lactamase [Streptococcus urinalis 2285-97]EKS19706.1 hypothetical protein HMPREF9318_01228 [Streptococcus urinalis FB127-CNA-2]VEF31283.1 beta-lactamase family protein [Streptococcus urinalis]